MFDLLFVSQSVLFFSLFYDIMKKIIAFFVILTINYGEGIFMNKWIFYIADILSFFLMCGALFASYPTHRKWVAHPKLCRCLFFLVLCLTYFLYNHFQSTTFVINTFLYPAILAGYALVFLDENFFACLSQILLFTSVKSALPALFGNIADFLDRNILSVFSWFEGYGTTSFSYDFATRLLPSVCMIGVYFYLTRFAVKSREKFPVSYWITMIFCSVFCIVWGLCSYPEYFAAEYASMIRCIVSFGFLTINLMVYYLFYRITTQFKENLELKVLQQRISLDNEANAQMNQLYLDLRKVRHDLLNHIGIMDSLLKEKHYKELEDYFSSILRKESPTLHYLETGNIAVNALLNRKVQMIRELKIPISAKAIIPKQSSLQDADLCAILGNLLDNASEAVCAIRHGRIDLNVSPHTGYLVIQSSNTVDEDPLKANPLLLSTKGNSPFHGLGLKIIKNTVKKYDGILSMSTENHIFSVKIMIPLSSQKGIPGGCVPVSPK